MIILLTNEFPQYAGGIATYCYELTDAIAKQGHPIAVIAADKGQGNAAFDQQQIFPVARVREYPWAAHRHLARYWTLVSQIQKYPSSLLWASDWRTGVVVLFAARRFRLPFVVTAYGTEVRIASANRLKRQIALQVYEQAELVVSISEYTRQLLIDLGVAPNKIHVTPLGIDPSEYLTPPSNVDKVIQQHNLANKRVILSLSRLTPRKGQDVMITALPQVLTKVPNAVYLIAGKGDDEPRLRALIAEHGLGSHVIMAGYVAEELKSAYYYACDVYVMLSRQEGHLVEGFGLTLLEAGACQKPVVGGRHGGVVDTVLDGETGLLVDPFDVQAAAEAVSLLLSNDKLAATYGENARRHITRHANWETTAEKTFHLFKSIANL
jgi:phosphatidylinositol alpha-1,6-mannosyltransferase